MHKWMPGFLSGGDKGFFNRYLHGWKAWDHSTTHGDFQTLLHWLNEESLSLLMCPLDLRYLNISNFASLKPLKLMQRSRTKMRSRQQKCSVIYLSLILARMVYTHIWRAEMKTNGNSLTWRVPGLSSVDWLISNVLNPNKNFKRMLEQKNNRSSTFL